MTSAAKTASQQRGRPFRKGQSGNPDGRPLGSRHKTTVALDRLLDGEAENLVNTAIELAKGGDGSLMRALLDRLVPPRKSRPVSISIPSIKAPADLLNAMSEVVQSAASGAIDVDEAVALAGLLDLKRKAIETVDIERRLTALEAKDPK